MQFAFVQLAVAHHAGAVGVRRHFGIVGDQDDGVALAAQALEQREDFLSGARIQRAGGSTSNL